MKEHRGPHYSAKCPFFVIPNDPLSATDSIEHCVSCVTCGHSQLEGMREDFRQTAFVTVLEETPKYDPEHPSGASFRTFIKSKVCCALWRLRRREQRYLPCGDPATTEVSAETTQTHEGNPLGAALYAASTTEESLEDAVGRKMETDRFRACLPALLAALTEKERAAVTLKYVHDAPGKQIAETLGVSEGRISQLTKSALARLRKGFCR